MNREKVLIVLSHKYVPKKGSHPGRGKKSNVEWEVAEQVEFVSSLKNKHISMSSAIGDYINRKMITGAKVGMDDYSHFEEYVRKKYSKEMAELDAAYSNDRIKDESSEVFVDQFGNVRARTVFDPA